MQGAEAGGGQQGLALQNILIFCILSV